jgi:UrcA family protein
MQRKLFAAIATAAILAFATAAPASAETSRDTYEARISIGDLNLQSEAGADAFLRRVHNEARGACGDRSGRMSLTERRAIRACMSDFQERAVAALDNDYVTTRFAGEEPRLVIMASR